MYCNREEGTDCLVVSVEHLEKVLIMFYNLQKGDLFHFLMMFMGDILQGISKAKILDLSRNYMKQINVHENSFVYDLNDDCSKVYIVREGQLVHDTIIEHDSAVKFPCDTNSWEIDLTTKTILYNLRTISKGDYFGHEEILNYHKLDADMVIIPKRCSRVRALTNSNIIEIDWADFMKEFPTKTREQMHERFSHLVTLDYISSQMNKYTSIKKMTKKAILDATNL